MKIPTHKSLTSYIEEPIDDASLEMLRESNAIEGIYSEEALNDAKKAWSYALKSQKNLTTKWVLGIHLRLMESLEPEIAGKYRDCPVWIGGKEKVYVSQALLAQEIKDWLTRWNYFKKAKMLPEGCDREAMAKQSHVEFEGLHVFSDGNGRTGRIIYNVHRLVLGLPIHIIKAETKYTDYYPWFKGK